MNSITFITGGQRSGKSSYAQKLAISSGKNPVYLATSRVWDADFKKRIERHQADRGEEWTNLEIETKISEFEVKENSIILIDCMTLWLANFFSDMEMNVDEILESAKEELNRLFKRNHDLIIVSNEVGMSLHAETELGRKFTDVQGWVNQFIAKKANNVVLMVSGIPVKIK